MVWACEQETDTCSLETPFLEKEKNKDDGWLADKGGTRRKFSNQIIKAGMTTGLSDTFCSLFECFSL